MADEIRTNDPGDDEFVPTGGVPEEELAPLEEEQPRRAAHAEFEVTTEVGSEALLREAMDPANQSLREALRLSYRVLQVVIVLLIVVFVFSGFQQVDTQQSGVMLRFGRIVGEDGQQALEPGAQFNALPYPAGEFVIFQDKNREVGLGRWFWPSYGRADNFEQAVEAASTNAFLMPGPNGQGQGDGYVLTSGGDIAHIQLAARYEITHPVRFVNALRNDSDANNTPNQRVLELDADAMVRLALKRALVHKAAAIDLETFAEFSEQERVDVRREAQRLLDRLDTGIRITEVSTPIQPTPALAIRKAARDLDETRRQVQQMIESAREQAQQALIETAGARFRELVELIDRYELAVELDDEAAADALLEDINIALESGVAEGQVANIIQEARSYTSLVESTLGQDAQRFLALLPSYRENPELVVNRLWAAAVGRVLTRPDTEILQVPDVLGTLRLQLAGDNEVQEVRRDKRLNAERAETQRRIGTINTMPWMPGASDMQIEGPGRQLDREGNPATRKQP